MNFIYDIESNEFQDNGKIKSGKTAEIVAAQRKGLVVLNAETIGTVLSMAQLVSVYNLCAETPVDKFKNKATAIEETWKMLRAGFKDEPFGDDAHAELVAAAKEATKAAKGEAKAKEKGERKPRAAKFADTAKITMLRDENPCREGTRAHRYFALTAKCKTIAEFVEKFPKVEDNDGKPHAWIGYALKQGHISVA